MSKTKILLEREVKELRKYNTKLNNLLELYMEHWQITKGGCRERLSNKTNYRIRKKV